MFWKKGYLKLANAKKLISGVNKINDEAINKLTSKAE